MNLPRFYFLGKRPAKIARTEDGRVGAYIFNRETGEFDLNMTVLDRVTKADNDEAVQVSEEEFEKEVEELRKKIKGKKIE